MKSGIVAAGLAALTLFDIAGAQAADLPLRAAPPIVPVALPSWTGFYVGVQGGYRFDETKGAGALFDPTLGTATAARNFKLDSGVGGPRVGYDLQVGPSFVVGVVGDFSWGDARRTASQSLAIPGVPGGVQVDGARPAAIQALDGVTIATGILSVRHQWDASVRVRAGYLFTPTFLGYVTGGLALLDERVTASYTLNGVFGNSFSASRTRTGWTVGAGIETMLTEHWRAHVEYRYADYGSETYSWASEGASGKLKTTTNTVLAGVSYKF